MVFWTSYRTKKVSLSLDFFSSITRFKIIHNFSTRWIFAIYTMSKSFFFSISLCIVSSTLLISALMLTTEIPSVINLETFSVGLSKLTMQASNTAKSPLNFSAFCVFNSSHLSWASETFFDSSYISINSPYIKRVSVLSWWGWSK